MACVDQRCGDICLRRSHIESCIMLEETVASISLTVLAPSIYTLETSLLSQGTEETTSRAKAIANSGHPRLPNYVLLFTTSHKSDPPSACTATEHEWVVAAVSSETLQILAAFIQLGATDVRRIAKMLSWPRWRLLALLPAREAIQLSVINFRWRHSLLSVWASSFRMTRLNFVVLYHICLLPSPSLPAKKDVTFVQVYFWANSIVCNSAPVGCILTMLTTFWQDLQVHRLTYVEQLNAVAHCPRF